MSENLVTFNIRCEKSQHELKMPTPVDLLGFIKELKNELQVNDTDDLIILCPMPDGKMMEISSDNDISLLKKTKLSYNAVSNEIFCNVELVTIIIHKPLPDDPKVQIMTLTNKVDDLTNKVDDLTTKFVERSHSFDNKITENTSIILENMRLIMLEQSQIERNPSKKNSIDKQNTPVILDSEPKINQQQIKKEKEKLSKNLPNLSENLNQQEDYVNINKPSEFEDLLELLSREGFNNTIQNIIVLKRFGNDYDKAVNYLKSGTSKH